MNKINFFTYFLVVIFFPFANRVDIDVLFTLFPLQGGANPAFAIENISSNPEPKPPPNPPNPNGFIIVDIS